MRGGPLDKFVERVTEFAAVRRRLVLARTTKSKARYVHEALALLDKG